MQRVAALALVGLVGQTGAVSVAASAQASAWLRAHDEAPGTDELAELKNVNPSAYAIVQALLTKRSLGLLDPKHPTANFAGAKHVDDQAASGPGAFQAIAEESGEKPKAALAYPDAPSAPSHHDYWSWKPQQSAVDDEAMVSSVLGEASSLKAAPTEQSAEPVEQQPAPAATTAPAAEPVEAPAQPPKQAMNQENSYLKGIDFSSDLGEAPKKKQPSLVKVDNHDYLASFSFDDDAPAKAPAQQAAPEASAPAAPQEEAAPVAAAPAAKPKNALLAWLGGGDDAKPAAPKKPAFLSTYMTDLQ